MRKWISDQRSYRVKVLQYQHKASIRTNIGQTFVQMFAPPGPVNWHENELALSVTR